MVDTATLSLLATISEAGLGLHVSNRFKAHGGRCEGYRGGAIGLQYAVASRGPAYTAVLTSVWYVIIEC